MQAIQSLFSSFQLLTEEEFTSFTEGLVLRNLKKGEFFIQEGSVCRQVAFISSGLFRSFYHSSTGDEVTYCFTFEHSFLTAFSSYITQQPTEENIEALTDVELLLASKEKMDELEQNHVNWLALSKYLAQIEYINMEKRVFMLQKETAETRYRDLLENHPDYLHLIPLQYLASYLGITPRHLSRIRKAII